MWLAIKNVGMDGPIVMGYAETLLEAESYVRAANGEAEWLAKFKRAYTRKAMREARKLTAVNGTEKANKEWLELHEKLNADYRKLFSYVSGIDPDVDATIADTVTYEVIEVQRVGAVPISEEEERAFDAEFDRRKE